LTIVGYKSCMNVNVPEELKQTVGKALGRIPSGVFVITSAHGARRNAMLASWVQQCDFNPPAVSIAVAKDRAIVELFKTSKLAAISVLPADDTALMKRYARGVRGDEDPFEGVETATTPGGAIVMSRALAWLECRLLQTCSFGGDHELFIAQVTNAALLHPGDPFMHVRGSGFHY
jgi:3-hydroxy-9,10-secoandrosta-1,3,5(10)-triene-9,17-dione monooxygenase reductase component